MKIISLLLLAAAACPLVKAIPYHPSSTHAFTFKKSTKDTLLKLRGGDLGPISSDALAKTFGVLAIGDAVAGTVAPIEVWDKFGIKVEPGSKGEHYLGHGIGSSASSLAVTSLLALTEITSIEEAIGYGILTRCAYMTEMLLTNKYKELGVPTTPHITIYLILLAAAFGLVSGNSDYVGLAKVVSIVLAGHGGLLFLNPRIDDDERTKKMAKVDGGYMFISSFYTALLSFGVDPIASMGYTAIFCIPLFLSVLDLVDDEDQLLFGLSTQAWTFILVTFIGTSAYGMLE
eukprot:170502_1